MSTIEMTKITEAFINGEKIERQNQRGEWLPTDFIPHDWMSCNLRIKPKEISKEQNSLNK